MFGVQLLEFVLRRVVTEHVLVNGLQEQAGSDGVESGVVLHVLKGNLNHGFVELLRGDSVEQRQFELGADLRNPGELVGEPFGRVFDREVDFVRVVVFASTVSLDNRDVHRIVSLQVPEMCRQTAEMC